MALLDRFFILVEETVPAILMGVMVAVVLVDVSGRYLFNRPFQGAGEFATLLFVWQVFLGAAGALRRHLHIGIDYFVRMLPMRGQSLVRLALYALLLVTTLAVAKLGWDLTLASTNRLKPILHVPYTYIYIAVPLGFGLMAVHILSNLLNAWRAVVAGSSGPQEADLDFGLERSDASVGD